MRIAYNFYVYILACKDESYYIGVTNDLERRVKEHNDGINKECYTFLRRPVTLKYYAHYEDINQAIAWEKKIKGWSRKKKEALFIQDWDEIKKLARNSILRQAQDDKPSSAKTNEQK